MILNLRRLRAIALALSAAVHPLGHPSLNATGTPMPTGKAVTVSWDPR